MVIDPMTAFLNCFTALSPDHRRRLAHIFFVCTPRGTGEMLADPRSSHDRFLNYFTRPDFPLRVVARVFTVRTLFDLLLIHRKELVTNPGKWIPGYTPENMISLDTHLWNKVYTSWGALRSREMSDRILHTWASGVLTKKPSKT